MTEWFSAEAIDGSAQEITRKSTVMKIEAE